MVTLGRFAVLLSLGASLWAAAAAFRGARRGREELTRSAEGALYATATALSVAAAALVYALVTRDFSVAYVADYSSRSLSLLYTVGAFWAGQAGSLLLWAWALSLYAAVVVYRNRVRNRHLMPWVVGVLGSVTALFAFLVAFLSNPFERLPFALPDGQGLNPLLQNYGQMIHPVTVYLGFVGFTVPFAFCIAALATGRLDDGWTTTVRRWTLWAWLALTAGIILGARWAYVELGWGGYWAWDPVENASLLPWLTGTAYLHSVMVQERKGMLRVWNVSLAVATFALALFGTFLTRSGVVSSVHAFASSPIGPFLIGAVFVVVAVSGGLIAWRLPELRSTATLESVASRESSFLLNNLLLVGMAFAVLWGTVFPIIARAVRGVEMTVGAPFFNAVMSPMGIALLALVGFCPLLAWRKTSMARLRRNFVAPLGTGAATAVVLFVLGAGKRPGALLVASLAAFVAATIVAELYRGARARRRLKAESWSAAVTGLFSRNPRRYGGFVIHLGVVVLLLGIAVNVAYKTDHRATLAVGESTRIAGYELVLSSLQTQETSARFGTVATLAVRRASDGKPLGSVLAQRFFYENQDQPTTEVGIRATPGEDLYVILEAADPAQGQASLRLLLNPGVLWIWVGGLLMLTGGLLAARQEHRPLRETSVGERMPVGSHEA